MYRAVLFTPDGDKVIDFTNTRKKSDVADKLNNMGSRWYFYPIHFICTDKTIVEAPDHFNHLVNKRITTAVKYFKDKKNKDYINQYFL